MIGQTLVGVGTKKHNYVEIWALTIVNLVRQKLKETPEHSSPLMGNQWKHQWFSVWTHSLCVSACWISLDCSHLWFDFLLQCHRNEEWFCYRPAAGRIGRMTFDHRLKMWCVCNSLENQSRSRLNAFTRCTIKVRGPLGSSLRSV